MLNSTFVFLFLKISPYFIATLFLKEYLAVDIQFMHFEAV